jgi:serine protease inhibitor ecotin
MRSNIDVLRGLCFSKEDLEQIQNLGDQFTEKEIEFMIEFKKIYELGLNQLEKFINKLDEEGKDLETWDIDYYVRHLLNGPLTAQTLELSKDKKYFKTIPDILGVLGNNQSTRHNTTLYTDDIVALDVPVDVYNKTPEFSQKNIINSNDQVEQLFRSSMKMAVIHDNTLPIADKKPQDRYSEEKIGKWVTKSNGSFAVKDSFWRVKLKDVRQKVFDKVKEMIGEEHYRIFGDRKTYTPFDSEKNDSVATAYEIEKIVVEGDKEETFKLDVYGDVYDTRDTILKVENPEKNKEYLLNTVEGQFGL